MRTTAREHNRRPGQALAAADRGEVVTITRDGVPFWLVKADPGKRLERGKPTIAIPLGPLKVVKDEKPVAVETFSLRKAGIDFDAIYDDYIQRMALAGAKRRGGRAESRRRCEAFVKRTKATQDELEAAIDNYFDRQRDPQYLRAFEYWWTREADADLEEVRSSPSHEESRAVELQEIIATRKVQIEIMEEDDRIDELAVRRMKRELAEAWEELEELVSTSRG